MEKSISNAKIMGFGPVGAWGGGAHRPSAERAPVSLAVHLKLVRNSIQYKLWLKNKKKENPFRSFSEAFASYRQRAAPIVTTFSAHYAALSDAVSPSCVRISFLSDAAGTRK